MLLDMVEQRMEKSRQDFPDVKSVSRIFWMRISTPLSLIFPGGPYIGRNLYLCNIKQMKGSNNE